MYEILLYGSYALPLSVNETYFTDDAGRRRLSYAAREYKEAFKQCLDIGAVPDPHVLHLNIPAIQQAREVAFLAKQGKKKFLGETWYYQLKCLYVFGNKRRDLDNGNKLFQDTLFEWLELTDKLVIDIHAMGCVDKTCEPHIEFFLRRVPMTAYNGMLLDMVAREHDLPLQYAEAWWDSTTEKQVVHEQ